MSESIIPAVLLRALSEYKFVGHPLWRMADGKDHVRVELTFHKTLPMLPVYKRRAESRRQPAPSAGEWPCQPTAARQPSPTTTRPTPPARQQSTMPEKEKTASTADTTARNTSYHHSAKTTEDSTDYAITYHPETSSTTSFSRITTDKEALCNFWPFVAFMCIA